MSREAFGDPPEQEPQRCPLCDGEWHAEGCELGDEVARRLKAESELEKLMMAVGRAYGYLWCVMNNEPGTPHQYPPERAAYEARKLLRDTMTPEQRGYFINAVLPMVREAPANSR